MVRRSLQLALVAVAAVLAFVPSAVTAQTAVSVALTEAPPSVTPDPTSVSAGAVTFEASNVGGIQHELVVIRTDLAADALPVSGDTVDLGQLDVIADTDPFDAGQTRTLDANLEAGDYVLICNVPGHYGLGMRAAFTVTGGDAGAPAPSPTQAAPAPAASGSAGLADGALVSPLAVGLLAALAAALVIGARVVATRRGDE